MLVALAEGRAVYGVNTGMGAQSGVRLSVEEQAQHQHNLLLARAAGGPPWLSRPQTRALLATRVRTFISGDAGVSPELVAYLIELLNADVLPAVPAAGYGSAGEIVSLAHAFGPAVGIGHVLAGSSILEASVALAQAGLVPLALGPKEGIALLQGIPGTTALATLVVDRAQRFVEQSLTTLALSLLAVGARRDPYLPLMTRGDRALAEVNTELLARLGGSDDTPRSLQAPVSFRVATVALAHVRRCIDTLDAAIERALMAISDSPAYVGGEFHGSVGFDGLDLAAHLDSLSVALVHAAELSAARSHRLLDSRFTGLTAQLAARPGPDTGLVTVHKRAVGVVHRLRRVAIPSTVGAIETSFGQADVQTFSWEAAGNADDALAGAEDVLASELLIASQAVRLSERRPGPGLDAVLARLAEVVPAITGDRPFGQDVEALRALIADQLLPGGPADG
jgi:histidine ammonia-lyase